MFSFNPVATAAARAASPAPKSPDSSRPNLPYRRSSTGRFPTAPKPRPPAIAPPKHRTPLRSIETVYYDAQPYPQPPPPQQQSSSASAVTITFSNPGFLPPLYVTSSLNDWELQEMAYTVTWDAGQEQVVYYKDFAGAEPGQHMYRFRIGRQKWLVDDSCEVVRDSRGELYNILRVEKKEEAVQPSSPRVGDRPRLPTPRGSSTSEKKQAQLTIAATNALQLTASDLTPSNADPAQFSELAVSPPASDSLHSQGILGSAIETAIRAANPPSVTYSGNASTTSQPPVPNHAITPPIDSPRHEDTAQHSHEPTASDGSDEANQELFFRPLREPAEVAAQLGIIPEVIEVTEETPQTHELPTVAELKDEKHQHHRQHHRGQRSKWGLGRCISIGALLIGGAIAGVLVGVVLLQLLEMGPAWEEFESV